MLLVFDVSYYAWRAAYTTGGLKTSKGEPTGVRYGVIKEILKQRDRHPAADCVFCYDMPPYRREKVYGEYKAGRHDDETAEEKAFREGVYEEILQLRTSDLPRLGFFNQQASGGFEADDLIAAVVLNNMESRDIVVYSNDEDLWQLLRNDRVWCCNGKSEYLSRSQFMATWGFDPRKWPLVKALAGCNSDNIKGVHGVGEKTAAKYFLGQLKPGGKKFESIKEAFATRRDHLDMNRRLVTLPWEGTPVHGISKDSYNERKRTELFDSLEFSSIEESFDKKKPKGFFA